MKKCCVNHPGIEATHFIEEKKPVKGFHGPANLVTKIWLCEKCYHKNQTDLFDFTKKKDNIQIKKD
ncbi:MAG: hypothetical protein ACTSO9_12875 [Candidatus Helarchaeota archaeon]